MRVLLHAILEGSNDKDSGLCEGDGPGQRLLTSDGGVTKNRSCHLESEME